MSPARRGAVRTARTPHAERWALSRHLFKTPVAPRPQGSPEDDDVPGSCEHPLS